MSDRATYFIALAALFVAVVAFTRTRIIEARMRPGVVSGVLRET